VIDVSIDTTLRIAEIVSVLVGGGVVAYRLGRTTQRMEASMDMQRLQIKELQADVKELNKLMMEVALQKQRLDIHGAQIIELQDEARRPRKN